MHPFQRLAAAEKRIPIEPTWSPPDADTEYCWIDAPLEIGGSVEPGLILHVGFLRYRPDCNVTFEVRVSTNLARRRIPLMRIDWKALSGGHTNQPRHGTEWAGRRVGDTHNHAFVLNWHETQARMKRHNLPVAMPIAESLQDFSALRTYVGREFKISNIDTVPVPGWEYKLL
ncbi:hypothetical protein [Falsiroseomonas bella]|uniref:hypothetical protein n=1 Tax=Falsiroseomonas bella TaxID=2184016 RepID=UPI001304E2C6|nr:hypothetical protein [Falsiroseomonas bella]